MTRNRFVVGVVLAAVAAALAAADTLYLRDGEQHPGALKKMSVDRVWFGTPEGVLEYPKTDVLKVQLQRARQYDEVETVAQITDPDLKACLEALPGREEYEAVFSAAAGAGAHVFSDEMYRLLEADPADRLPSACELAPLAMSRLLYPSPSPRDS